MSNYTDSFFYSKCHVKNIFRPTHFFELTNIVGHEHFFIDTTGRYSSKNFGAFFGDLNPYNFITDLDPVPIASDRC